MASGIVAPPLNRDFSPMKAEYFGAGKIKRVNGGYQGVMRVEDWVHKDGWPYFRHLQFVDLAFETLNAQEACNLYELPYDSTDPQFMHKANRSYSHVQAESYMVMK